jgi:heterodisulfide reductase subunit A
VVGAGITGLRAALGLSDLGISTFVVEKEDRVGGWVGKFGTMFPHNRVGRDLITELVRDIDARDNVTVFTNATLVEKSGSIGDFDVTVEASGERISLSVGAIVVATGFDVYRPAEGEHGYGHDRVLTLPDFKTLLDEGDGPLEYLGKPIRSVAYVYCVGSCTEGDGHQYCSRYCCSAAMHTSLTAHGRSASLRQYHLYRDIRTYGKYELLYTKARAQRSVFIEFDQEAPPSVEADGDGCRVTVADLLTGGKELELRADVVVLVTAMQPRSNERLDQVLKLPVGLDGFLKEVHPKLRPVETVIDGIFIAGAAQAPRSSAESVASALAAAVKSAALLKKGSVELEPLIAVVDPYLCTWCGICAEVCPYGAIEKVAFDGKEVAVVNGVICKGGGTCVPVCPQKAIQVRGSTESQITAMIDAMEIQHV